MKLSNLRVKVINNKSNGESAWWENCHIGEEFEVLRNRGSKYQIVENGQIIGAIIPKSKCELVK